MIKIKTKHPIAVKSADHIYPEGTKNDNFRWRPFNEKLYKLLKDETGGNQFYLMDWGCSGGQYIVDCHNDGHIAVGLEGSDYSVRHQRANWPEYHNKVLFTCDLTKPLDIFYDDLDLSDRFNAVTAWEFMEHISEADLPQLFDNLKKFLPIGGLFICSIGMFPCGPHHVTIKDKEWWKERIESEGFNFESELVQYFDKDFVRGTRDGEAEYPERKLKLHFCAVFRRK